MLPRTRCQILRLECTKFDFGWGSAPDPAGELIALPQTPQLDLRGPISKGGKKRGRGREARDQEKDKAREGQREARGGGQRWKGNFRGTGEGKGKG